ncbi:hypothetical protein [Streptomyces flaveolus]
MNCARCGLELLAHARLFLIYGKPRIPFQVAALLTAHRPATS